jgi:hypothetical protein
MRFRAGIVVLAAGSGACEPTRFALPVPLALTQGATAVPARGFGGGIEFGDGFRGQELMRTEALSAGFTGGIGDRASVSVHHFFETRGEERVEGNILRAKVRAASLTGPASSIGVAISYTWTGRDAGSAQNERVRTVDLAVPAEWLVVSSPTAPRDLSMYAGPRMLFERYTDRLDPVENLNATLWGGVYGLHGRLGDFHLFAEASLIHVPARTVRGTPLASDWTLIPAFGASLYIGRSHDWGREPTR